MNTTKKINVNFSSLVGLKAELLRKQTEIKDTKAKEDGQPKVAKPKVKSKKTKKKPKTEPGYTEIEDMGALKRSKVMLEAKTMLYERLKKTGGDDMRNYLVDFANKSDESEEEIYREEDYEDANSDPEDDWVDYKDCFGRTRKCLRRDLPKMREKDDLVKRDITKEPVTEERPEVIPEVTIPIPEKEPEIEIMRKKWEEQMERLADKSDIHYQDVLFDEARAHGVGYYAFSQNEEERAKQQENLAKLRKETEQRQRESQEIRDLKSKMELNRLRAAMIRQRVRSGLSAELTEEEEAALRAQVKSRNSNETQEEETSPEAIEAAAKKAKLEETRVDNSLIVVEDKIKAFGELLGKRPKWHEMSQEEWIYKRRKDRLGEFAPVYENFRRADCLKGTSDNQISERNDGKDDPVRINASGPEPTDLWETQGPSCRENFKEESRTGGKSGEIEDTSGIPEESRESVQVDEDNEEEDLIGPLPPSLARNSGPPTFINSFVPQTMPGQASVPLSFVRTVPPPPIINFSIPPPSIVPPPVRLPTFIDSTSTLMESRSTPMESRSTLMGSRSTLMESNSTLMDSRSTLMDSKSTLMDSRSTLMESRSTLMESRSTLMDSRTINPVIGEEDSSDSDDSIIIGPVPPPSINDFSSLVTNCGPSLIDNKHINMLSDIPLPATVKFPPTHNYITGQSSENLGSLDETENSNDDGISGNLDVNKISAGLKYLRRKFDKTSES